MGTDVRDATAFIYHVGDALGVAPKNNAVHVNKRLLQLTVNGQDLVRVAGHTASWRLHNALSELFDLGVARGPLIAKLACRSGSGSDVQLARKIGGHDPRSILGRSTYPSTLNCVRSFLYLCLKTSTPCTPLSPMSTRKRHADHVAVASTASFTCCEGSHHPRTRSSRSITRRSPL